MKKFIGFWDLKILNIINLDTTKKIQQLQLGNKKLHK